MLTPHTGKWAEQQIGPLGKLPGQGPQVAPDPQPGSHRSTVNKRQGTARGAQQEWEHFSRIIPAGTHELASSLAGAVPENQQQAPPTLFLVFQEA